MFSERVMTAVREHAAVEYARGRESCGLIVVRAGKHCYVPCRNVAGESGAFAVHPEDYASAEDSGDVVCIVHSHPDAAPTPSQADLVGCERSGLPWLIIGWPTGATRYFSPSGYKAPLIGRHFTHGVLDCYALIRDYYRERAGIDLPDYTRADKWWLSGQNLYLDGFESAGFVRVETDKPRLHDGLLMQIGAPVPNHAAVWLGDGTIMHHMINRLSTRDVYGGWYQKVHTHTLRHRSLL